MKLRSTPRGWFFTAAAVVLLALVWMGVRWYRAQLFAGEALEAAVSVAGKEVCFVALSADAAPREIDLSPYGVKVTLEVRDGAIRFEHSDCPDQICVHTGWLSRDSDIAVCMPNRTIVVVRPAGRSK